jgi:hypothetical protein
VSAPSFAIRRMIVTFNRDDVEVSITYSHDHEPASAGSKKRTTTAARMARKGLERALEGLEPQAKSSCGVALPRTRT